MSISQQVNKKSSSSISKTYKIFLKKFFSEGSFFIKRNWFLLVIFQSQILYIYLQKKPIEKENPKVIIEAKNTDVIKKQKELEKQLDYLNSNFLSLQAQHAKIIKSTIAVQEQTNKVSDVVKNNSIINLNKNSELDFSNIENIGEKINRGEKYFYLLTLVPQSFTNHSSFSVLKQYSENVPLNIQVIKEQLENISKNKTKNPNVFHHYPSWINKLAEFFKGQIEITKISEVVSDNAFSSVFDALNKNDLNLALSASMTIENKALEKWREIVKQRIIIEDNYKMFLEHIHNTILNIKKDTD